MESLLMDLRYALRQLRRAPAFAAVVVLSLALGIGASTAIFSLVDGILLEPLPYPSPDRLVRLTNTVSTGAGARVDESDALVLLYQSRARAFDNVGAWRFDDGDLGPTEPGQSTVRVRGARVTANFFDLLGVRPALGRAFAAGEDRPRHNGVVVLSYAAWQERFHGDPAAVGRHISVNDVPRTIIGIMPPRFAYPASSVDIWLPLSLDPASTHPETFDLTGIARLRPGVSPQAARAELASINASGGAALAGAAAAAWQQAHVVPRIESLTDSIAGPVTRLLWLVFASVLLVLLVACTNVAALCLVRAERAEAEFAVRRALGAGLARMLSATVAESVLLALAGGACGLVVAALGMRVARSAGSVLSLPRLADVRMSATVHAFGVVATLACAIVVSLLPLMRARRVSAAQVLRGASAANRGRGRRRSRELLVVAQVALALVLVASSSVVARSFLRLTQVPLGFDARDVVSARVLLPYARYGSAGPRLDFFKSLVRETRKLPGVRDVALTDWVPLSGDHADVALDVEGAVQGSETGVDHAVARVDENYFETMQIPLLRGRALTPLDAATRPNEVVVSKAFAELYWPGVSPIGKRVRPVGGDWYTIVGEAGDAHYTSLDHPAEQIAYFPIAAPAALSLVARSGRESPDVLRAVSGIVRQVDPSIPVYDESQLTALVSDASARTRTLVALLAAASVLTSLIAAIGLYGVVAYVVGIRRRELGIRIALGAEPGAVSRMVSLGGVRVAGMGLVAGAACTLASSRLLEGLVYGVAPNDAVAVASSAAVLLVLALVASWIPARRAAAIDPAEALRAQ